MVDIIKKIEEDLLKIVTEIKSIEDQLKKLSKKTDANEIEKRVIKKSTKQAEKVRLEKLIKKIKLERLNGK